MAPKPLSDRGAVTHVINVDSRDGVCFETIGGVTLCGRCYDTDREDVSVEEHTFEPLPDPDDPHAVLCTQCHLRWVGLDGVAEV